MVVRRIRVGEGEPLRAMRLAFLRDERWRSRFLAAELTLSAADWEARAARGATSDDLATFVVIERDDWIGVADAIALADGAIDVAGMWVDPRHRRRGAGTALLRAIEAWTRVRGARELGLWVVETNTAATALYERSGFSRVDEAVAVSAAPHLRQIRMTRVVTSSSGREAPA